MTAKYKYEDSRDTITLAHFYPLQGMWGSGVYTTFKVVKEEGVYRVFFKPANFKSYPVLTAVMLASKAGEQ